MNKTIIILAIIFLLPLISLAKRTPPPVVQPIIHDGIQYIAPNDNGKKEYIRVIDLKTGVVIKEITVKKNIIWPWREGDVQCVYIMKMEILNNQLVVTDEKNRVYKVKLLNKTKNK